MDPATATVYVALMLGNHADFRPIGIFNSSEQCELDAKQNNQQFSWYPNREKKVWLTWETRCFAFSGKMPEWMATKVIPFRENEESEQTKENKQKEEVKQTEENAQTDIVPAFMLLTLVGNPPRWMPNATYGSADSCLAAQRVYNSSDAKCVIYNLDIKAIANGPTVLTTTPSP